MPASTNTNSSGTTTYLNYIDRNLFRISYNTQSKKVVGLHIEHPDVAFWLRRRGVTDPKLGYLGMHRDQLIAALGKPDDIESGHYEWEVEVGAKTIGIEFQCYDHDQGRCTAVWVSWL